MLGTNVSRWHQDINPSKYQLRRVFWQNKGHRQIYGLPGHCKVWGTRAKKRRGLLRHRLSRYDASTPALQKYINTRPGLLPSSCIKNGGQIRCGEGRAKCWSQNRYLHSTGACVAQITTRQKQQHCSVFLFLPLGAPLGRHRDFKVTAFVVALSKNREANVPTWNHASESVSVMLTKKNSVCRTKVSENICE